MSQTLVNDMARADVGDRSMSHVTTRTIVREATATVSIAIDAVLFRPRRCPSVGWRCVSATTASLQFWDQKPPGTVAPAAMATPTARTRSVY